LTDISKTTLVNIKCINGRKNYTKNVCKKAGGGKKSAIMAKTQTVVVKIDGGGENIGGG
jgi:hypothetical protein